MRCVTFGRVVDITTNSAFILFHFLHLLVNINMVNVFLKSMFFYYNIFSLIYNLIQMRKVISGDAKQFVLLVMEYWFIVNN